MPVTVPMQNQNPEPNSFAFERQVDLKALFGVIRRRKWTIVGTVVVVVGLAFLAVTLLERKYTATALVVVDPRESNMLGFEPGTSGSFGIPGGGSGAVDTEVEIARSSAVLRRAAEELDLANSPEFANKATLLDRLLSPFGVRPEVNQPANANVNELPPEQRAQIVERLSRTVDISRRGFTNIIEISATRESTDQAATTANTVADAYLEEQLAAKLKSNEQAVSFLRERVNQLAHLIREGEARIDQLGRVEPMTSRDKFELGGSVAQLENETSSQRANTAALTDIVSALRLNDFDRLARLVGPDSPDLAAQRQALLSTLSSVSDQNRSKSRADLEELDRDIAARANERIASLRRAIKLSETRTAELGTKVADDRQPSEVSLELFNLQRNVETNRALYDGYLSNMRSIEQQVDFNFSDSRVVAPAWPPAKPTFPPTILILSGALVLSIGLGTGLAFLREQLVGGIISVEQLEELGRFPVLAGVPHFVGRSVSFAIVNEPLSPFSEAIRRIRFGIDSFLQASHRCICVTSPQTGDGKTTIAMCLARQYAMTGRSTLLIDADLRQPGVHQYLNGQSSTALTDFLSASPGDSHETPATAREPETGVEYLLGKPLSTRVTDAMLMSSRFDDLMKFARANYDVVILDAPPAGMALDAAIVTRYSDLCILVARYAQTREFQVLDSLRDLSRVGVPLCTLLNQVPQTELRQYVHGR